MIPIAADRLLVATAALSASHSDKTNPTPAINEIVLRMGEIGRVLFFLMRHLQQPEVHILLFVSKSYSTRRESCDAKNGEENSDDGGSFHCGIPSFH